MPSSTPPIGVIGLGLMGSVLTRRLLDAGFSVLAHDIDPAKCTQAAAMGARPAPPEQMARECQQVVLALFDTDQVEQIVRGPLASSGRPLVVTCTSTCDPDLSVLRACIDAGDGEHDNAAVVMELRRRGIMNHFTEF